MPLLHRPEHINATRGDCSFVLLLVSETLSQMLSGLLYPCHIEVLFDTDVRHAFRHAVLSAIFNIIYKMFFYAYVSYGHVVFMHIVQYKFCLLFNPTNSFLVYGLFRVMYHAFVKVPNGVCPAYAISICVLLTVLRVLGKQHF